MMKRFLELRCAESAKKSSVIWRHYKTTSSGKYKFQANKKFLSKWGLLHGSHRLWCLGECCGCHSNASFHPTAFQLL